MREIRFRSWNSNSKKMEYMEPCYGLYTISFMTYMQYTGLKDKNGKKIYEGDIVDATYCIDGCLYFSEDEYGIVVWDDKKCGFFIKFKDEIDVTPISYYEYLEVIGNIYENPELLEGNYE